MKNWQHAIITGGASGLGLGIGTQLLHRGGKLSVLDLSISDAVRSQLDQAAQKGGGAWAFHACDVTQAEALTDSFQALVSAFGQPSLVINSAGIINNQTFENLNVADFRRVIEVNLFGSFNVAKAALPVLQNQGRLALVASMAGLLSNYGYTAYGTSKFGVVGLATTLRYEYAHRGVGITCVCPPEVKTPMVKHERSPGNADPISLALKDFAGSLEVDEACDAILAGIDEGQFLVVPGVRSKATLLLARHCPSVFFAFLQFNINRLSQKMGSNKQA